MTCQHIAQKAPLFEIFRVVIEERFENVQIDKICHLCGILVRDFPDDVGDKLVIDVVLALTVGNHFLVSGIVAHQLGIRFDESGCVNDRDMRCAVIEK